MIDNESLTNQSSHKLIHVLPKEDESALYSYLTH